LHAPLETNLNTVRSRIADAAVRAGRRGAAVRLLAVTKSAGAESAAELCKHGQIDLGESRASELERKAEHLAAAGARVRWHFVGHVQRNKARRVVQLADVIHSVDSIELLTAIDRLAGELGRRPALFVQVKLHDEPEKTGLSPDDAVALIAQARSLRNIRLWGLMTMAPLIEASIPERDLAARRVFEGLRELARTLDARAFEDGRIQLSMGMSEDFEIAIESGSDWVRIGSLLFADSQSARGPESGICGAKPGEGRP
jgi:PLP dependent protein